MLYLSSLIRYLVQASLVVSCMRGRDQAGLCRYLKDSGTIDVYSSNCKSGVPQESLRLKEEEEEEEERV
jgi:uncharacterized metal-binding protein